MSLLTGLAKKHVIVTRDLGIGSHTAMLTDSENGAPHFYMIPPGPIWEKLEVVVESLKVLMEGLALEVTLITKRVQEVALR
ncbi:hypothetical protein XSP_000143 [Xanthomonas sp. CPBF 426]|uniref:hypothetical protein n=1 Tax=Xanthomonas sp. CPBF 426 TaxID=2750648 RepID=UPI0015C204C4|nr:MULTISPECIES: hypothetical protein [Xanthomonas]CAD1786083.1 hypothetical protein XSP_000143 [Xanthomonas sp. CPBF 426]CAG2082498.1 hypothetical protein XCY_000143 [Xanthomonas euroxanthea]